MAYGMEQERPSEIAITIAEEFPEEGQSLRNAGDIVITIEPEKSCAEPKKNGLSVLDSLINFFLGKKSQLSGLKKSRACGDLEDLTITAQSMKQRESKPKGENPERSDPGYWQEHWREMDHPAREYYENKEKELRREFEVFDEKLETKRFLRSVEWWRINYGQKMSVVEIERYLQKYLEQRKIDIERHNEKKKRLLEDEV